MIAVRSVQEVVAGAVTVKLPLNLACFEPFGELTLLNSASLH